MECERLQAPLLNLQSLIPQVQHSLLNLLLSGCDADIHVIVKIESADSIPNLHSIITASDGAMVARGDIGAELPIEEVPLLQEEIISICWSMGKAVIVATNMLESMIVHPTPTKTEVSDIAIVVREGFDVIMLSAETAHGNNTKQIRELMQVDGLTNDEKYRLHTRRVPATRSGSSQSPLHLIAGSRGSPTEGDSMEDDEDD